MRSSRAEIESRVAVLKAIASLPRFMILEVLADGDRSVSELTEEVGSDISTVSRHLAVLRNAGILSSTRNGSSIIYHLRTPCVMQFCSCVDNVLNEDLPTEDPGRGGSRGDSERKIP